MKNTGLLIAVIFLLSFTTVKSQNKKVEIKTEIGSIITELYPEKAPVTCENFLKYIENKNYDNASFYRVVNMNNQPNNEIKIEVIQGGLGFNSEATSFLPYMKLQKRRDSRIKMAPYLWRDLSQELQAQSFLFALANNQN